MKKNLFLIASVCFIMVALFSCSKYEQGPGLSFRSKTKRLANSWKIESITINGIERASEPLYAKQKHYIYESGSYIVTIIDPTTLVGENVQGSWKLYDNDTKMSVTRKSAIGSADVIEDYSILKLKEKDLWLRSADNSTEIHFAPFDEPGN